MERAGEIDIDERIVSLRQHRRHVVSAPLITGMVDDADGAMRDGGRVVRFNPAEEEELVVRPRAVECVLPAVRNARRHLHDLLLCAPRVRGNHRASVAAEAYGEDVLFPVAFADELSDVDNPSSAISVARASPICVLCSQTIAFAFGP
jgi:hypothetical protein